MKKTIIIDKDVWDKLCEFRGQRIVDTAKDFKLSRAINELLRKALRHSPENERREKSEEC